jgi:hypothetical protein
MPIQFIPSGILEKLNGLQMSQVFFKIQLYRLASSSGQILKKEMGLTRLLYRRLPGPDQE